MRLPATTRRTVPDAASNEYATHHSAVYADPRITHLDAHARYTGQYSRNEGATWKPIPIPSGWTTVCGGHVQTEVASALLAGWDVVSDGPTRIIREGTGNLIRWTVAD